MPDTSKKRSVRLSRVNVICFDLNETLIDWSGAFQTAFRESIGDWVGRWSEAGAGEDTSNRLLQHYLTQRNKKRDRLSSIRSALSLLPMSADELIVSRIANQIRELQPKRAVWIEGAEHVMEQLSGRYRIAIVTNLERQRAQEVWARLRMNRFMKEDDLFTRAGKVRKPKKAMYVKAAAKLGEQPGRCLMVGDSYRHDVEGAIRAGWQAVWVKKSTRRLAVQQLVGGRNAVVIPSIQTLLQVVPTDRT